MKTQLTRVSLAVVASFAITALAATPAHAAVSTITSSPATVAAGSALTLTLTPGTNGLTDVCNRNNLLSGTNNAAGFSIAGWATLDYSTGIYIPVEMSGDNNYVGAGFGSFNPTTQTSPIDVEFVIPQDAAAGDYIIYFGCIGPSPDYVAWNVPFGSPSYTVNVSVTAYVPPPAPEPDPSSASSDPLPVTGLSLTTLVSTVAGSIAVLIAGAALVVLRRRNKSAN